MNTWECLGWKYCDDYVYNPVSKTRTQPDGDTEVTVTNVAGDFTAIVYSDKVCIDEAGTICADYQFYGIEDATKDTILEQDVEGILGLSPTNENGTPSYAS